MNSLRFEEVRNKGTMEGTSSCENFGRTEQFQHLNAYVSGSTSTKAAILLISDVFGYENVLLRKLADKIASAGYLVVVPDYFYGDSFKRGISVLEDWLKEHQPEKGFEDSLIIIEGLKMKGISCIGAAGFCWGSKVAVLLSNVSALKVAVLLHPSFVTLDDIKDVKVPIAILGAEDDKYSPPIIVEQFRRLLLEKPEIDSFVNIYPKVSHGWSIHYDERDKSAVKHAKDAHSKMLEWFHKHMNTKP